MKKSITALAGAAVLAVAAPAAQADPKPTVEECPAQVMFQPSPSAATDAHPLTQLNLLLIRLTTAEDGRDPAPQEINDTSGSAGAPAATPTSTGERPEDDDVSC